MSFQLQWRRTYRAAVMATGTAGGGKGVAEAEAHMVAAKMGRRWRQGQIFRRDGNGRRTIRCGI